MYRRTAIVILVLVFLTSGIALGQEQSGDDWKFYGMQVGGAPLTEPLDWFYLANQVHRVSGGNFLIWTEALSTKAVFVHNKDVVERVNGALERHYFPPYFIHNPGILDTPAKMRSAAELLSAVVTAEQVADEAVLTAEMKVLVQMDCANQRYELMSTMGTIKGKAFSSDTPNGWEYIPPDSTMSALAALTCPSQSVK